jgi:hypothetical protein
MNRRITGDQLERYERNPRAYPYADVCRLVTEIRRLRNLISGLMAPVDDLAANHTLYLTAEAEAKSIQAEDHRNPSQKLSGG